MKGAFCYRVPTSTAGVRVMRRSRAAFVLAVFLLGMIASADAFARGSGGHGGGHGSHGRGGHHASGAMNFTRSAPRGAVVVTAPVIVGGVRYRPYSYYPPPVFGFSAGPYYPVDPYYYPSAPYYSTPYYAPEYVEQGQDQPLPQPGPPQQPGPEQQSGPAPQQPPAPVYLFCPSANNYFPYVRTCPSGWQRIPVEVPPS